MGGEYRRHILERRLFALCLLAAENFATFRLKSKIKATIDVYDGCIYSHCALVCAKVHGVIYLCVGFCVARLYFDRVMRRPSAAWTSK